MDDREVVAASAAGHPAGIATAYDNYAAGLYGYCHWMLRGSQGAAEALRGTFLVAATTPGDLPETPQLRPWLYAVARDECQRGLLATSLVNGEATAGRQAHSDGRPIDSAGQSDDATLQFPAVGQPTGPTDATLQFPAVGQPTGPTDATLQFPAVGQPSAATDATLQFRAVGELADAAHPIDVTHPIRLNGTNGDPGQADPRTLIRSALEGLKPAEREAIELSLRHDLYDSDLATALGVSWSQAHALTSRARAQLEKDLGTPLIAHIGRQDCPMLDTLLVGWDGRLTELTRDLVGEHIEHCGTCAGRRRSALRPAVLSGLQPLAVPPPGLRDDVLRLCSSAAPNMPADQPGAEPPRSARFSAAIRALRWGNVRRHPGAVTAGIAIVLWIVAAVGVTLLVLTRR